MFIGNVELFMKHFGITVWVSPFVTWQHLDSSSSRGDGNLLSPPCFELNRFDIFIFTVLSINGGKEETLGACPRREEEEEEEEEEERG